MANILSEIAALRPMDPSKVIPQLARAMKWAAPAAFVQKHAEARKAIDGCMKQLSAIIGKTKVEMMADELALAREQLAAGTKVTVRSWADVRERALSAKRLIKQVMSEHEEVVAALAEPVVADFRAKVETFIADLEVKEKAEAERFGLPSAPSNSAALRSALCHLSTGTVTWLLP